MFEKGSQTLINQTDEADQTAADVVADYPPPSPPPPLQEKSDVEPSLPERLLEAKQRTVELALAAGEAQQLRGLDTTPEVRRPGRQGVPRAPKQRLGGTRFSDTSPETRIGTARTEILLVSDDGFDIVCGRDWNTLQIT